MSAAAGEWDAGRVLHALRHTALSPLDWHLARELSEIYGESSDDAKLLVALVSRALSAGHVCLDLERVSGRSEIAAEGGESAVVDLPELDEWHEIIANTSMIGRGDGDLPLVVEGDRVYTRRYWHLESKLGDLLAGRCTAIEPAMTAAEASAVVTRLYERGADDRQRVAAVVALHRRLTVITGGPGTGKTHATARLLVVLAEDCRRATGALPVVRLLAPTGKAANRLGESLQAAAASLECDEEVRALVRTKPMTIHRALGRRPRTRTRFRHDENNPLRADIVVVDEASMVDVALLSSLVCAVADSARLILLGDRDQLASVEAGAVLADLCGAANTLGYSSELARRVHRVSGDELEVESGPVPSIRDSVVTLVRNYRYDEGSEIGLVAAAIQRGDGDEVLALLRSPAAEVVKLEPPIDVDRDGFFERVDAGVAGLLEGDAEQRLRAQSRFRVLCALRRGPFGVEEVNRAVETRVRARAGVDLSARYYAGQPIMVVRNDVETELFNGDVGVLVDDGGEVRAAFARGDDIRLLSLGRLPAFEVVYATTIHKSQGSEYDDVAIVLPDEASPILTRELLYTALTRARSSVRLYASQASVERALRQRIERASGLAQRLGWERRRAAG